MYEGSALSPYIARPSIGCGSSVEREGEQACVERRHGHPTKLRGDVLTWVLEYCQSHASASSSELQCLVAERFSLDVACQSTEPCPCRSRTEPPSATARKKSRKRASRLPQDIMNRLGACCCWRQPPRQDS